MDWKHCHKNDRPGAKATPKTRGEKNKKCQMCRKAKGGKTEGLHAVKEGVSQNHATNASCLVDFHWMDDIAQCCRDKCRDNNS